MEPLEPLLTTEDVANYLKVDVVTVRRLVSRGELAAYRVGNEYRFTQADMREFLKRQRVPVPTMDRMQRAPAFEPFDRMVKPLTFSIVAGNARPKALFESWTRPAKRVLAHAQEEAERLQHPHIGTEHILLGLVRDHEGIAGKVLEELGAHPEQARSAVEFMVGRGEDAGKREERALTSAAKQSIEQAMEAAQRLGHHYIGTEHLLLGLVADMSVALGVLEVLGISPAQVQQAVMRALQQE